MQEILDKVELLKKEIQETSLPNAEALEKYRIRFLGTKGLVKELMSEMKNVSKEMRKDFGEKLNEFKIFAETKYHEYKGVESPEAGNKKDAYDYSLPAYPSETGSRHPIQIVMNKMISIFEKIGFTVTEGPEIEDDWHNFNALNLPENHPARDMQDTFYISKNPDWLLRTHTSSVQVRVMKEGKLPIRQIFPGRVYRNETVSARAHCFFHQIEGLYIDEKVSFADLKQTLYYFVKEMFGADVNVRFRPSYFPFTEPSAEVDIYWGLKTETDYRITKGTGWLEIMGCGMVDPNVLKNCGINPDEYNGFAFGMGIERIAMLLYQIGDIRMFYENDVRFLEQFKSSI